MYMALGSLKSVAGVVEKWIGARVLDLGHNLYSWLFCKEHSCDNGALHATPVLQFSSYATPHLQPINYRAQKHKFCIESRVQSRVQSSPESIDPDTRELVSMVMH